MSMTKNMTIDEYRSNTQRLGLKIGDVGTLLFFLTVLVLIYQGWLNRDIEYLTAEQGIGYALGIVGGVMMLLLLLYPLRKRIRRMKFMGPIKYWFRLHMVLGILGPTAVLFHCNFGLGATNSNIALFCMSIVAASGLLGRYFYARIHHGLYGSQATLHGLQQASSWQLDQLVTDVADFPQLQLRLQTYEKRAIQAGQGYFSFITIPWFSLVSVFSYISLRSQINKSISEAIPDKPLRKKNLKMANKNIYTYFKAVRKVAEFSFYERLFSAWHVFHLPLFMMMLITSIVHVVAVHMY